MRQVKLRTSCGSTSDNLILSVASASSNNAGLNFMETAGEDGDA